MTAVFRSSILLLAALAITIAMSPLAFAQNKGGSQKGSGQSDSQSAGNQTGGSKKTTVNFEDQLIEGQTQKPELFYLLQQRNNNFKRLIKLRENFLPEMRKTSEDISRKGSGS